MIKKLFLFLFIYSNLFSLNITVSLGENNNNSYSLVEISRSEEFRCQHIDSTHLKRDYILCEFGKIPLVNPRGTENSFFVIKPYVDPETKKLFVELLPKFQAKLFPKMLSTLESDPIYKKDFAKAQKWFVLGYKEEVPFLQEKEQVGLNFPIKIEQWRYPTIGSLDVGGVPIEDGNRQEFIEYSEIKRLFDSGEYNTLLNRINRLLRAKDVNRLFMPEILSYKIKALSKLSDREREIVDVGAPWVRNYTSHKDLPEIMFIVSKAYLKMGIIKEANEVLEVLIKEYPSNAFAERGKILQGDRALKEGKKYSAQQLYEEVLYDSSDVEVASLAAFKLAKLLLSNEDLKGATDLFTKIINSNPKFFGEDKEETFLLAQDLADRKVPAVSARLAEILFENMERTEEEFKDIVLAAARWFRDANEYKKSLEFYERYLRDYSYVENIGEVRTEIDYLRFEMDAGTPEERLSLYDLLIQKYPASDIAKGAKYKKMMLYLEENRYEDVAEYLSVFEDLDPNLFPNLQEDVKRIARQLVKINLEEQNCQRAVNLLHQYNILLPSTLDLDLYGCAIESGDFSLAIDLSQKYINSQSAVDSLPWQKRELNALYRKSDFINFTYKAERVARIEKALEKKLDKDLLIRLFNAYDNLERNEELIPLAQEFEQAYPNAPEILDLWRTIIEAKLDQDEFQQAYTYAIKLLNGQRLLGVETFSPFVEFALADSAKEIERYEQAIIVLQDLIAQDLSKEALFEGMFKLGELYALSGNNQRAQEVFGECSETEGDSQWKDLCTERVN